VATGFLVGIWIWGRLLARYGLEPEQDQQRASDIAVWLLVGVIGGARLMYVAVESARYLRSDVTPAMLAYLERGERAQLTPEESETARHIAVGYDFLHDR
jgi:prolipoprotein diacylglyceryltransferase